MKLILVDPNISLCNAFLEEFKDLSDVEVVNGIFENLPEYDCMVSAANSYGSMSGGVDLAIRIYFGMQLERRVQDRIITEYHGEQPIGTSMVVRTDNPDHPYLAHTPTMRIPENIQGTDNVYIAMWSMLNEISKYPKIKTVACPGFGTLTGGVSASEAAQQMALAYKRFISPTPNIWGSNSGRYNSKGIFIENN